jgi:hypothetical protein
LVRLKIDALMEEYPKREWLAYLVGDKEDDYVRDLFIPKQIASSSHVRPLEFPQSKEIIGVIHSHHSMGHTFSGTDDEFINANHDISIVVSNSGYSGHIRTKTPCGCIIKIPVKIEVDYGIDFDKNDFIKESSAKITEPVVVKNNLPHLPTGRNNFISKRPIRTRFRNDEDVDLYDYNTYGSFGFTDEDELEKMIEKEIEGNM